MSTPLLLPNSASVHVSSLSVNVTSALNNVTARRTSISLLQPANEDSKHDRRGSVPMLASQQQHQYMKYRQNILSNQDGAGDYKTIISKITDKHASSISIHARAQPQQSKFSLAPTVYIDQTVTVSPNDGVNSNQSDNNDGPLFPLTFQKTSGSSSKMFPASFAESGHRKSDAFATASAAVAGGESGNRSGRRASVQSSSDVFFNRKNSIIGRKKSVTIDMAGDGAEAFQNYSMSFAKAMESAEEAEAAAADGASKEYMNHNRIMKWLEGVIIDLDDVKNDPVMAETLPAAAAHEDGVRDDESDDSPNESIEHSLSSSDSNEEEGGNNTGDEKRDNDGSQPIMGFIGVNLISDAPLDLEPHTSKDISMYEIRSEIVKLADDSSSNDTEKHEGNEDTQIRNAFSSWMQAGGIGGGGVDGRSGGGMTAGGASHEHKSGGRQVTIRLSLAGGGLMRRPSDTPSRRWDRLKSISFGRPAELIMQIPKEPGEGYQQLGHTEEDEENMTEEEEQENVDEQNDVVANPFGNNESSFEQIIMTRAASSKRKKTLLRTVITPQQRLQQQIEARYVGLFPRGLKLIIVGDAITIVKGFAQAYKQQLGDKHDLTLACLSHLDSLKALSRGSPSDYNDKPKTLSIQNLVGSLSKMVKR